MLIIERKKANADKLRQYKILVDENEVGKISEGESVSIPLQEGVHKVYLKIDWGRSEKLSTTYRTGDEIHLEAISNLNGFKIILALLYATVLSNKYIQLKKI